MFVARYGGRVLECTSYLRRSKFSPLKKRKCYSCQWCGHQLYPLSGTVFHKSSVPLRLWFFAVYLFVSSKNGVSAKELQRQLGVTYKCAWRIARLVRTLCFKDSDEKLSGEVETDKSWFGYRK